KKGNIPLTNYLGTFKISEYVDVKLNGAHPQGHASQVLPWTYWPCLECHQVSHRCGNEQLETESSRRGFMSAWSMFCPQDALRNSGLGRSRMTNLRPRRRLRVWLLAPRDSPLVPSQVS
ncbi:hypothetical protein UlMin_020045, partial [Ulmus minor]